jgi:hypothetical protein
MPGARSKMFRLGDRSELLVQHLLSGLALTTPVPRQEDVGIDFMCNLISADDDPSLVKAGTFFSVQAKSNLAPLVYEKPYELEWIQHQENPLLICVADRPCSAMDVYSTWNLVFAVQAGWKGRPQGRMRLLPGKTGRNWWGIEDLEEDGFQDVFLGKPILRITLSELSNEDRAKEISEVMKQWLVLDRTNIINRYAGLHWVAGPTAYETGKSPVPNQTLFAYHPDNLRQCVMNLGRSAASIWNIRKSFREQFDNSTSGQLDETVPHIRELLRLLPLFKDYVGDLSE